MHQPLPVEGIAFDFRELTAEQQRIVQYAVSLKILTLLEKLELDPFTVEEREEIMTALSSAKTASDATQERLRQLITGLPTP